MEELEVTLQNVQTPQRNMTRAGTSRYRPDELIELGVRSLFLGDPLPAELRHLESLCDPGINVLDVQQAFALPNEIVEPITRLLVAEGLVGHAHASRIIRVDAGPRREDLRRLVVEWDEVRTYDNVEPERRRVDGEWTSS